MSIRTLEQLIEDQAGLVAEYRSRWASVPSRVTSEAATAVATIGKVTSVVSSDPVYGAHLLVQPQDFSGTPPGPAPATTPGVRAYPTPNHVVGDYSVNEYVVLRTVRGALLAVKLG